MSRFTPKNHFALTYRGENHLDGKAFASIGIKSLKMMEDSHGEKLALISLDKPKRASQVQDCITDWNLYQLGDANAIHLTPHSGNQEIITFGKSSETMTNHYIYKMIMDEREKSLRGETSTYVEWTAEPPSKVLKNLGNNLAEGYIKPAASKRMPQKVTPYTEEQFTVKRKRCSASVDTESEGEDFLDVPKPADPVPKPAADQGMPDPDEPKPKVNAQPQVGKQTVVVDFEVFVDLNKTALKAKDEVCQSKDDANRDLRTLMAETKQELSASRKENEKLRAHNEEKDALIQQLKDRYMKDNGKLFKPLPKRRGV